MYGDHADLKLSELQNAGATRKFLWQSFISSILKMLQYFDSLIAPVLKLVVLHSCWVFSYGTVLVR